MFWPPKSQDGGDLAPCGGPAQDHRTDLRETGAARIRARDPPSSPKSEVFIRRICRRNGLYPQDSPRLSRRRRPPRVASPPISGGHPHHGNLTPWTVPRRGAALVCTRDADDDDDPPETPGFEGENGGTVSPIVLLTDMVGSDPPESPAGGRLAHERAGARAYLVSRRAVGLRNPNRFAETTKREVDG